MLVGLPHNGENPDKSYVIFLGVRMLSCTLTGDSNLISASCLDNQDDGRREASIAPPKLEVVDDKNLQAQQQIELYQARISRALIRKLENRFQERWHCLNYQKTHSYDI